MHHGLAPYRDIVDINMPGAYAVDWLAVHLLVANSCPQDLRFRVNGMGDACCGSD